MVTFPRLSTGAVTQYPSGRRLQYATSVTRFVDGSEQRFREFKGPAKSWAVMLHKLSASEARAVELFFLQMQGQFSSFSFTDPWDGTEYGDCSFDQDTLSAVTRSEATTQSHLVIRKNTT